MKIMILFLSLLFGIQVVAFSQKVISSPKNRPTKQDTLFSRYLLIGDSIYATKNSLKAFEQSNRYYDSLYQMALAANDTFWLAQASLVKGRIYDAWNKEPQKTIQYLNNTYVLIMPYLPKGYKRTELSFYLRHLIAHAYEKAHDSTRCCSLLQEIYDDFIPLDTITKKQIDYISELALIATEVKNFGLAERILNDLVVVSKIKNNPHTYAYRDHYFLTKARIDVYFYKNKASPYLDSLINVYAQSKNLSDSAYYSSQLHIMYASLRDYEKAYSFLFQNQSVSTRLNSKEGIESMENQLLSSELSLVQREKELDELKHQNRLRSLWGLGIVLVIISFLSYWLYRKNKITTQQSEKLAQLNQALVQKNAQNELLTKEIHHRTKNNLQMIFSLLQMQERSLDNEDAQKYLQEARFRIESIANLHEQLLNSNNNIDFHKYITKLIHTIMNSVFTSQQLVTHLDIQQVYVPTDNILPLALILNEWITNTIKYAKCKENPLEIDLRIYQTEAAVHIHYKDNGIAVSQYKAGLGTHIISLFCRQIGATLTTVENNSFDYQLVIPYGE